ncbi:hypothetical protein AX16_005229 [Volvariella volvacea WC 439]|nr:hypothetical protein AX16_005229 [Volvariella volvacea WC 439]
MSLGPIVCQQCKEPLQLDVSLVDLAPSAYDMIINNLPTHAVSRPPTEAQGLEKVIAPQEAKQAWLQSKAYFDESPARLPQQLSRVGIPSTESFVLLQDSIIGKPIAPPSLPSSATSTSTYSQPESIQTSNSYSYPKLSNPRAQRVSPKQQINKNEAEVDGSSALPPNLRSNLRLFNILSAKTDVEHPLCAECTQLLLTALQKQLDEIKKERDGYIAFDKEVRKEKERSGQSLLKEEVFKQLERLQAEEEAAIEQLKEAERDRQQLDEELKALESAEKTLEYEEAEFWRTHNAHLLAAEHQGSQLASLRAAYAADAATLEKLERTNVYNDAFCIGHDGVFGTINGLRLGRTPSVPVDWSEVNAAWGQTLLLLFTIARKIDYQFEHYRLVPMGSFSRIEKTTSGDKATYELYGSGEMHFGRLLHNRRFDIAMVAFLDCLKHVIDHIKSQDPNVDFPHQIVRDKIGDVSIKLQFNQEEVWTRALRHVLLALKICLKWATNGTNG